MSDSIGFEEALKELENRVRALESGEVSLDEALRLFEEGVNLAGTCHEQLEMAEDRISALSKGHGGIERTPVAEPNRE